MAITLLDESVRHEGIPILADSCRVLAYLETDGHDTFFLDVPAGYELDKVELCLCSDLYKTKVKIDEQPPPKATGQGIIKVHWWIDTIRDPYYHSFVEYRLIVTAVPLSNS